MSNMKFCPNCGENLDKYEPEENKETEVGREKEKELGEAAQELKELLEENPGIYDTLSPLEQRVIDELGLEPS